MVQRGEGIRIHPALHRRGCLRAFLGHPGERLPLAERRRDRRVRLAQRPERLPGGQRRARRIKISPTSSQTLSLCREGFLVLINELATNSASSSADTTPA